MWLILYSKPNCHLCEGLQEKLEQIPTDPQSACQFKLEIRDITTQEDWFQAYQYEVPVLFWTPTECKDSSNLTPLPRPSPRASVRQLEQMLQKYMVIHDKE